MPRHLGVGIRTVTSLGFALVLGAFSCAPSQPADVQPIDRRMSVEGVVAVLQETGRPQAGELPSLFALDASLAGTGRLTSMARGPRFVADGTVPGFDPEIETVLLEIRVEEIAMTSREALAGVEILRVIIPVAEPFDARPAPVTGSPHVLFFVNPTTVLQFAIDADLRPDPRPGEAIDSCAACLLATPSHPEALLTAEQDGSVTDGGPGCTAAGDGTFNCVQVTDQGAIDLTVGPDAADPATTGFEVIGAEIA